MTTRASPTEQKPEVTPGGRDGVLRDLADCAAAQVDAYLMSLPASLCVSVQFVDRLALEIGQAISRSVAATWGRRIEELAVRWGRRCPKCGKRRKCLWRKAASMEVGLLLGNLTLGKPYLACGTPGCEGRGLSVVRLLTGLSSGDSSPLLKIEAARQAAATSYGKAQRALVDHPLGRKVDRAKLRRIALEVEQAAMEFAEGRRVEASRRLEREGSQEGAALLVIEGDGGKVRVGNLRPPLPDEAGYGKVTPVRELPKRRRETTYREVITLDARKLGEVDATALDVMVPITAPEGERARRMLTLAGRKGLGDNTEVYGLGDMGSGLAAAFEEAFVGYQAAWHADKKHTWDYVTGAASVLEGVDREAWGHAMRHAILDRHLERCEQLLEQARQHRIPVLPDAYEGCPVHALDTYLHNNWRHMRFKEMEDRGLPTVSARAEAQVRDRTKGRFSVAGAWNVANIEGKATLRALIDEGSFGEFLRWYLAQEEQSFTCDLRSRLDEAIADGRLTVKAALELLDTSLAVSDILSRRRARRRPARPRPLTPRRHQRPSEAPAAACS